LQSIASVFTEDRTGIAELKPTDTLFWNLDFVEMVSACEKKMENELLVDEDGVRK
jgi:hypothetical protein